MQRRNPSRQTEAGFILLAVLFMLALLLIALAVAAPRIATSIQRDREEELIHRGLQYKRAIKLYYLKFHAYPVSIDQLMSSNNMRFLRQRYVDPMTGKDDWKIIHMGEAHVKPMGLFGQPIQNGGLTATAGSSTLGTTAGTTGSSSIYAASPSTDGSNTDSTDSNSTSSSSTSPFSGTSATTFGSGQTLGGAPMVGIASKSTKASLKEYRKQKHYNEWEFVYDPVEDMLNSISIFGGSNTNLNGNSSSPNTVPSSTPGTNSTVGSPSSSSPFTSSPQ